MKYRETKKFFLGILYLVKNPCHNICGDFHLDSLGHLHLHLDNNTLAKYTFSGIAIYHRCLFDNVKREQDQGLLQHATRNNLLRGELITRPWCDVGTPERLEQLNL